MTQKNDQETVAHLQDLVRKHNVVYAVYQERGLKTALNLVVIGGLFRSKFFEKKDHRIAGTKPSCQAI